MSPDFAIALADMRMTQTVRVLEWLVDNGSFDSVGMARALDAVNEAHARIMGLRERGL